MPAIDSRSNARFGSSPDLHACHSTIRTPVSPSQSSILRQSIPCKQFHFIAAACFIVGLYLTGVHKSVLQEALSAQPSGAVVSMAGGSLVVRPAHGKLGAKSLRMAIVVTGGLRTFGFTYASMMKHLVESNNATADFFVSTIVTSKLEHKTLTWAKQLRNVVKVHSVDRRRALQDRRGPLFNEAWGAVYEEANASMLPRWFQQKINESAFARGCYLDMLRGHQEGIRMALQQTPDTTRRRYDIIVRTRADQLFLDRLDLQRVLQHQEPRVVHSPDCQFVQGENDRLTVGTPSAMERLYSPLQENVYVQLLAARAKEGLPFIPDEAAFYAIIRSKGLTMNRVEQWSQGKVITLRASNLMWLALVAGSKMADHHWQNAPPYHWTDQCGFSGSGREKTYSAVAALQLAFAHHGDPSVAVPACGWEAWCTLVSQHNASCWLWKNRTGHSKPVWEGTSPKSPACVKYCEPRRLGECCGDVCAVLPRYTDCDSLLSSMSVTKGRGDVGVVKPADGAVAGGPWQLFHLFHPSAQLPSTVRTFTAAQALVSEPKPALLRSWPHCPNIRKVHGGIHELSAACSRASDCTGFAFTAGISGMSQGTGFLKRCDPSVKYPFGHGGFDWYSRAVSRGQENAGSGVAPAPQVNGAMSFLT